MYPGNSRSSLLTEIIEEKKIGRYIIVLGVCLVASHPVAAQNPSVTELLAKYADTQDKLQSFIIKSEDSVETTSSFFQSKEKKKTHFSTELRFDGNRISYRNYLWGDFGLGSDLVHKDKPQYQSSLWDGNNHFRYSKSPTSTARPHGIVKIDHSRKYAEKLIQRGYNGARLLGFFDDERVDSILQQADTISVRDKMQMAGKAGSQCYVIDAVTNYGKYTVWIDPEHGCNIAKAEVQKTVGDMMRDQRLEGKASFYCSISNVVFEKIDNVWVPMEADVKGRRTYRDGNFQEAVYHHKRIEVILNPNHDALGSFVPDDIENGAEVLDLAVEGIMYIWQDGKVVDSYGHEVNLKTMKPPSLVGKALPELTAFNLRLDPNWTENKMILVCFWDMNQRPSRNCIKELAKQAQQLKQQGVTIVAVQASKIDENKLNEWVKKNNIPFPVGMVKGDEEKARFAWGVKSLPWLILTDRVHIVRDEGFGIDELDEELKKNIDTKHAIQKNKATPAKPLAQTGLSDPAKSFLDAEAILAEWESSYAGIRTMRVSYCTRLVDYQPPANNPDIDMTGLVKYQHVERVEDGKRYHIRFSMAEDGFDRPRSLTEYAFDGKITRKYSAGEKHGSIFTGLEDWSVETKNDLKVYMLLKTPYTTPADLKDEYPNGVPELAMTLKMGMDRGIVTVRPKLESVVGQLCHVIEVTVPGKDYKGIPRQIKQLFWMAHDKGMCLMKYQWYWGNKLDREIEVEKIAVTDMDGDSIWYPQKAYRTLFNEEVGTMKYELTVKDFVPNVEVDENTFRFDFPKGTYVFDRVRGIAGVDLPKEPPSLVGKPLPLLRSFNLKSNADQSKGKMMFVCFFDMEQRPSRNCIMRLAKQAEQLKQKRVIIVAVQDSKVDENALNEWVKKNNIPFPIGMVHGDVEKTKFAWGIRSLPWLILTNRKHIVNANGFSLSELDEKINSITQK